MPLQRPRSWHRREDCFGETIKGFKIVGLLGKGGMGDVWMAEQRLVKTRVAIKLLREEASMGEQRVQRFFNEAIAAGKIKHAGIVKIFDVGFHAGRAFLIMELLEGETLGSRLRRGGRLLAGDVAEIGRQIASILEATHAVDIIHRDLKPDNVFLVPDTELESKLRVKILDFGIAKLGTGLTGTGESMGTPGYMAPEQWTHAAEVDALADVYSLGCLTFELCCGRPPFLASSIPVAYAQQMNDLPPRARSLVPDLPDELDDLLARMLARSPQDRPAVCDVRETFARLAASQSHSPEPLAMRPSPRISASPRMTATTVAVAGRAEKPRRALLSRRTKVTSILVAMIGTGIVVTMRNDRLAETPGEMRIESSAPITTSPGEPIMTPVPFKIPIETPAQAPAPEPTRTPATPAETAARTPASTTAPLKIPTRPRICPTGMVAIPGGTFEMGSPFGTGQANEHPQHAVTLSTYCMDRTEVTVRSYERCVQAKGCPISPPTRNLPDGREATVWARYCNREDRPDHPINCVDWSQADTYCRWADKRLPTEAEWEYAARGNDSRLYPWGNALPNPKLLNSCGGECIEMGKRELGEAQRPKRAMYPESDGYETTAPVGSYAGDTSPLGVRDLGGNVSEWTADWFDEYVSEPQTAPRGPTSGTRRSTRGGNWFFGFEGHVRSTRRIPDDPDQRRVRLGFRCARDAISNGTR